jgi:hypothetical protein
VETVLGEADYLNVSHFECRALRSRRPRWRQYISPQTAYRERSRRSIMPVAERLTWGYR